MNIIDLFPKKLLVGKASFEELYKIYNEIKVHDEDIKSLLESKTFGDNLNSTFNNCPCLFEKFKLNYTKSFIQRRVEHYLSLYPGLKNQTIKSTDSWINYNHPGCFQNSHIHGFDCISGVLYLHTSGDDGEIYFSPGFMEEHFYGVYGFKPENGMFLIFHGTLQHGVRVNWSENLRISLSFNFKY